MDRRPCLNPEDLVGELVGGGNETTLTLLPRLGSVNWN